MADLTTLAAVKADLKITDLSSDDALGVLISAVSARFAGEVAHSLAPTTAPITVDGNGRARLVLPDYPISAVTSVTVDGQTIPQRTSVTGDGWVLAQPQVGEIALVGYEFTAGVQNVVVTCTAGYAATPADVEQAVRETVVAKFKKDPNEQLQIASAGGEYTQFRPPFVWPPFAFAVIQAYRRPSVG